MQQNVTKTTTALQRPHSTTSSSKILQISAPRVLSRVTTIRLHSTRCTRQTQLRAVLNSRTRYSMHCWTPDSSLANHGVPAHLVYLWVHSILQCSPWSRVGLNYTVLEYKTLGKNMARLFAFPSIYLVRKVP